MGRFGPLTAKFFSPSNLTTALDVGGVSVKYPISGATEDHRDGEGSSTLVFVNDTALNTLAAVGNICWAYKTDSVRDDLGATGVTFCEPFIIRSRVAGPAPNEITISGPDLLTELKRYTIYKPLGALSTTNTTLAANAAAPVTGRTVAQTAVAGAEAIDASSVDGDNDPGKEIRIALNGGGTHVTIVQSINDSGDLVLRDRMPTAASAGNAIELRTRKVNVTTPGSFQEGVEAVVTLNSGSHTTLVAESVTDGNVVTLRDGLTGAANSGNAIQSKDYSGVSTSDITNIMAFVPGWTLEFETGTGTANGTRYPGGGETVYSILRSIVDETGEIFRLKSAEASPVGPKRKVVWRRTHDAAGIAGTVRLVMPSQADMATDTANKNRAILLERPRHAGEYDPVTQIIPIAGDPAVTLFSCSPAAVTAASAAGFEVVTTGLGLYAAPYIKNTALDASIGTHQRRVTFSEVTVEGANSGSIRAAADRMLQLAMGYMKDHVTTAKEIEARCISPVGIRPGQKVELYFVSPTGEYTIDYTAAPLYVQAVRRETANDGDWPGAPITTLSLSPTTTLPPVNSSARDLTGQTRSTLTGGRTLSREIGKRLQAVDRLIVSNNTPSLVTLSVATGGTGGGGGGTPPAPPTDHGSLTGLGDDDHTQYWNTSRGNSAIATHTAIADAHHAAVTAGNAAIGVATGQVVSLQLAGPSGLEIASTGLRVADTFAGAGLSISNKVIGLNLLGNSGLLISGNAVGLGTPGTLDTTTSSQVVGSGHFHAITSYTNAKTNPAHLIKSDAFGDVTLRFLTADKVISPELEAPGSITLDPGTSLIYADGNLSFVGARQIVTDSGSLTLAPAQTLIIDPADNVAQIHTDVTLRTAHAAVGVFPQTGWQVNYGGAGYFTSLMADELHVQSFIADIMRVKVGGEYTPESMALISRNITIPAVGGSATLYVEDVPGWNNIAAFADGDWVLLRVVDRSGGGLVVANAYGQVTNYTDLNGGEQSWTFTCRVATTAVGRVARRGDLALDFGKSGSSWWYVTVLDKTGPHAGFGTWRGNNPTEGVSYPIRLGQLHGVSGVNELGFQTGSGLSSRTRFTNLRNEIHGSRFSLYAGDGAQLRVCAASVLFYLDSITYQTLTPNADHSNLNVVSTGATFYQTIDEGTGAPVLSDYIANGANTAGYAMLGLGDPTGFSSIYQVRLSYVLAGVGFVNDTVRLYAQVFQSDELTPLTGEVLVRTQSSNASSISSSIALPHHDPAATAAEWSGARLRLRWEYDINANEEAIRLDPQVPSIAVGNPLPTGLDTGGDGLWVGASGGAYKLRLGRASGVGLRWDDTALSIRNSANQPVISLNNTGVSEFAGPMTLGVSGGIYQGTGDFATPTSGLKIWNSGGKGYISTFVSGSERVSLSDAGLFFYPSGSKTAASGIAYYTAPGGTLMGGFYAWQGSGAATLLMETIYGAHTSKLELSGGTTKRDILLAAGSTEFSLSSSSDYALLHDADLYVKERGIAAGYTSTPSLNRGQFASDFAGEHNFNAIVLQDTVDIAHGMTAIVGTGTYATLGKVTDGTGGGGLEIGGYTKATIAWLGQAYATVANTTAGTSGSGAFTFDAYLKSGTGGGAFGASDNLFVVSNNGSARFIVQGDGDFFYDGTGTAYDSYDDVALLRTLSREAWGGTVASEWDAFIDYNRQNLIDAGVMSAGGFINGAALGRLLTGAIWQLARRVMQMEERNE